MATIVSSQSLPGQKPTNLLTRMQSRTNVNVARTLFSNSLILDGPELQDWQITLQLLRFSLEPEENPVGGGSHHPQFPEDPYAGGEKRPSFPPDGGGGTTGGDAPIALMPEEPAGRGGRMLALPIERPRHEGDVDEDSATFPQEPIEDEAHPLHMALVWTFDGTNPSGVQQLVEVPSYGGDGYRPGPEAPGGAGGDRVPTGPLSSGQDDDGEELARLLQAFEAVPSYVGRFADGREVWQ